MEVMSYKHRKLLIISLTIASMLLPKTVATSHDAPDNGQTIITNAFPMTVGDSPCTTYLDDRFGGVLLDCSSKGIRTFQSSWIPPNTTTIILTNNNIQYFETNAFINATELRYLDISGNKLNYLVHSWFRGIESLHVLLAGNNHIGLSRTSFTESVFQSFSSLRTLDLGRNSNIETNGKYPDFLLKGLQELRELTLDTFATDLDFGSIFDNTTTLTTLILTGGVRLIRNSSFKSFYHIPLETLQFEDMGLLEYTELDAFTPLTWLKNIYMDNVKQRLNVTTLSLKPFVGRHFHNLGFNRLGSDFRHIATFEGTNVINNHNGQYLRHMCVDNLSIQQSELFAVALDYFMGEVFAKCLKTFDARNNPLYGEIMAYFEFASLQQLTSVFLSHQDDHPVIVPECPRLPSIDANNSITNRELKHDGNLRKAVSVPTSANTKAPLFHKKRPAVVHDGRYRFPSGMENVHLGWQINCSHLIKSRANVSVPDDFSVGKGASVSRCFRLPPKMEYIFVVDMSPDMLYLTYIVMFWPNNLKEMHMSRNGIQDMSGQIMGLDNLEFLDFSYNDANRMKYYAFDHFPSLQTLILREMNFDLEFISKSSSRFFSKLTNMETLDLTGNELNLFSPSTFANSKLKVLILAKNRFKSIPFDIEDTPHLCLLNLTYNSISALSVREMKQLDAQARKSNGGFSLLLDGNVLSCGCSQFRFMYWLHRTPVILDRDRNYACITEDGTLSNISGFRDLGIFWRRCNGKPAFFISIIALVLMCLAFTIALLLYHFKTRLAAYIHQVILRNLLPKSPSDYFTGVCIEYSDQDATFACIPLRRFIEEDLGLTTFVRHRDLLPNDFRDASISREINDSWRVLLVITEPYLTSDLWSFYAMKVASSSVTITNQAKVVLLVDAGLENKIPMCLLKAVVEGNVITMETNACDISGVVRTQLRKALCDKTDSQK